MDFLEDKLYLILLVEFGTKSRNRIDVGLGLKNSYSLHWYRFY